jgi:glycosyltransferase involved in cell wall biosynthesis
MRIAINGWFHGHLTTGSGQYLEALAEWLPRVGGTHELILIEAAERRTSGFTIPANWRIVHARPPFERVSANLAKLWFEQVTFPRACRRLRADVAFVPYWGSPWWRPCPVVVTVHDLIPLLVRLYRGGTLQRAYTSLVSRTARRAAAVLTDSEASKRDIIAHLGIPAARVHAIHLAVGIPAARVHAIHLAVGPRYQPVSDPDELARVRAKYGLPGAPFLLYLGGFDARKNMVRTIEGFAKMMTTVGEHTKGAQSGESGARGQESGVSKQESGVKLVIAGKLPDVDTAFTPDPRPVAAQLGVGDCVHFTGWMDEADKPALYSLALGMVFVSEY